MAKDNEACSDKRRADEIARRRTFAIISHPDAGKTTLTEKLLLYGGAVHIAGEVKAKAQRRSATSDWMAIEKERGISVATSVMQFSHDDVFYNLLDTPGHNDFSEDTYRTLAAADCAVMLIDVAKGVEPQTRKLFEVCRLRKIPIVTFVNKLDREGKPAMDLLEEIEEVLGIPTSPLSWPVGMGKTFQGVYDRKAARFYRFERADKERRATSDEIALDDDALVAAIGETPAEELREELELLDGAGTPFDFEAFRRGEQTPVFFGSAMNSFGVEPFLAHFKSLCPEPLARDSSEGEIEPDADGFSGFVFKIQANMDKRHRDRIAFVRVCSGRFFRGMKVKNTRTKRDLTLDRSVQFMAQSRSLVDEAFAGDILGLWDPGVLRIGDSLSTSKNLEFFGMPTFSPEHFARIRLNDPMRRKQLQKGLEQLSEEGAVQLFYERHNIGVDPLLGAVGWLQVEVVLHRLKAEYNVEATVTKLPYGHALWVTTPDFDPKPLLRRGSVECLVDVEGRHILLFDSEWTAKRIERQYDDLTMVAAMQPARSARGKR